MKYFSYILAILCISCKPEASHLPTPNDSTREAYRDSIKKDMLVNHRQDLLDRNKPIKPTPSPEEIIANLNMELEYGYKINDSVYPIQTINWELDNVEFYINGVNVSKATFNRMLQKYKNRHSIRFKAPAFRHNYDIYHLFIIK